MGGTQTLYIFLILLFIFAYKVVFLLTLRQTLPQYKETPWEIDVETVSDCIFLGSKITADDDCSHEIERCLLLGRKVMTNLDSNIKAETLFC